jgi:4-aminobutyrate aminotransferase-like enzyme
MWGFETQGVIPDIVTLGKPLGNGHPLGAVVTTPEIARSFANGMEYFSTFGGNPVSMAVGLAVLQVIQEEGLQAHAGRVGRYLRDGFRALAGRHALIGDVRGLGLFMGVELVHDRDTLEPASALTARLIEQVKREGVLLSAEGPHLNVLKIKPPLPFAETDADLLLGAVDRALEDLTRT